MADHPCHRCMQPVAENAAKCPHCGSPQVRSHTKAILIALASAMVVAALVLVFFMTRQAPAPADPDPNAPSAPSSPDKPPPLNQ